MMVAGVQVLGGQREGRVSTKRPFVGQGNPPPVPLLMRVTTRVTRMMRVVESPFCGEGKGLTSSC